MVRIEEHCQVQAALQIAKTKNYYHKIIFAITVFFLMAFMMAIMIGYVTGSMKASFSLNLPGFSLQLFHPATGLCIFFPLYFPLPFLF